MVITTLGGIIVGFGAILLGLIMEGGHLSSIMQVTAFLIVIGGTIGAVMVSFPGPQLMGTLTTGMKLIFLGDSTNIPGTIDMLVELAVKARKEGILALQSDIKEIDDSFLRKGLELMTDGTDPTLLRDLLETELSFMEEEYHGQAKVMESAGALAPTIGILGAVLGLIHVMENLADPSSLGSGIAVAFVATVYGVGFANLIAIPMGSKIKFMSRGMIAAREMMIEGILSIQAGESPNFIRQKLMVFDLTGKSAEEDEG